MNYRDLFLNRPDFFRSIRIDADPPRSESFQITPAFLTLLERVLEGIEGPGARALTVTGPFGTGKSMTLLHLGHLLEMRDPTLLHAIGQLQPSLADRVTQVPRLWAIPVLGIPGPLAPRLLQALERWAQQHGKRRLRLQAHTTPPTNLEAVAGLVSEFAHATGRGIFLIWDELGKHLEFAVHHPDANDVYLLQLLAEAVTRHTSPPSVFIGVLHQTFTAYVPRLLQTQRDEFAKVHGRFEDVAFHVPESHLLRLIGDTVYRTRAHPEDSRWQPLERAAEQIATSLIAHGLLPAGVDHQVLLQACRRAVPLHPAVTMILGPVFRHLGQNERSLFGFLGSAEPFGFIDFLRRTVWDGTTPIFYTVSALYDYLTTSLGGALYQGPLAQRWSRIAAALARVEEAGSTAASIIKTMGLLEAVRLSPPWPLNEQSLALLTGAPASETLQRLVAQSLVVYRRFAHSYRLWEGSDIDIEQRLADARSHLGLVDLADCLSAVAPSKPVVARRHSSATGTLRWFEVIYRSPRDWTQIPEEERPHLADGRLYLVLGPEGEEPEIELPGQQPWQVVCWLPVPDPVAEAIVELHYLSWVESHTPELRDDPVARKEVAERRHALEQVVESAFEGLLSRPTVLLTLWLDGHKVPDPIPATALNTFLSTRCNILFPKAPRIHDEFLNRHELSSNIAAARNDVLRRMIEHADEELLGITGYPPQRLIYLTMLRNPGLHQFVEGHWQFGAPPAGSPWYEVWHTLETRTSDAYHTVAHLWEKLTEPPFGLRRGVLPVLTVAFLLVHQDRLSLLEDNRYVPELTVPVVERMVRSPERFAIRLLPVETSRARVLDLLAQRQLVPTDYLTRGVLGWVKPLLRFVRDLPPYSTRTATVSPRAQAVRQALLLATEPADLLFVQLARALELPPLTEDTADLVVHTFVERLEQTIHELARAYPGLLDRIRAALATAFGYPSATPLDRLVVQLQARAEALLPWVNDLHFKAIVLRMARSQEPRPWLESVAGTVVHRIPKDWTDLHEEEFRLALPSMVERFQQTEALITVRAHAPALAEAIHVGFTTLERNWNTVVAPLPDQVTTATDLAQTILGQLQAREDWRQQATLVAIALLRHAANPNSALKEESHYDRA